MEKTHSKGIILSFPDKTKAKQEAQKRKQELAKVRQEAIDAGKDPEEAVKEWTSKNNKKALEQKKRLPPGEP